MTALVPLNNPCALAPLRDAGVEEIYVGFHDGEWSSRFGDAELNRMSGFGREANPFDFGEMLRQIRRACDFGMKAFVCFNATSYTPEQHEFIAQSYLAPLAEGGAHGIIVSSQALVAPAREFGLDVTMSTIAGIYNARLAAYYKRCGATRVILPRDLSVDEITQIMQAVPDLEYEVFLMRNGCLFSDSHCLGQHRAGEPSLCTSLRSGRNTLVPLATGRRAGLPTSASAPSGMGGMGGVGGTDGVNGVGDGNDVGGMGCMGSTGSMDSAAGVSSMGNPPSKSGPAGIGALETDQFAKRACENERVLNECYHRRTCGLCALWRFQKLGVNAYKVVGRGDDVEDLCADAALVMRNAAFATTCETESEYLRRMERPREPETLCGYRGLSCYYPEISRKHV